MPSCSIGFCVAITMNGCGTAWVTPSTVTFCSSMTSSSADRVFGEARLISSASTTEAKTGPSRIRIFAKLLVVVGYADHVGR